MPLRYLFSFNTDEIGRTLLLLLGARVGRPSGELGEAPLSLLWGAQFPIEGTALFVSSIILFCEETENLFMTTYFPQKELGHLGGAGEPGQVSTYLLFKTLNLLHQRTSKFNSRKWAMTANRHVIGKWKCVSDEQIRNENFVLNRTLVVVVGLNSCGQPLQDSW